MIDGIWRIACVVFFIASSLSALMVKVPTSPSGETSRAPWIKWLLCLRTALSISLKSSELNLAVTENLLTSSWLSHSTGTMRLSASGIFARFGQSRLWMT